METRQSCKILERPEGHAAAGPAVAAILGLPAQQTIRVDIFQAPEGGVEARIAPSSEEQEGIGIGLTEEEARRHGYSEEEAGPHCSTPAAAWDDFLNSPAGEKFEDRAAAESEGFRAFEVRYASLADLAQDAGYYDDRYLDTVEIEFPSVTFCSSEERERQICAAAEARWLAAHPQ